MEMRVWNVFFTPALVVISEIKRRAIETADLFVLAPTDMSRL
jgi:hypothetical protein